jgi:hypothetical protein
MVTLALSVLGCSHGGYKGPGPDASVHEDQGVPQDAAVADAATTDLGGTADLRAPADMGATADFAVPADLAAPADFATRPDLAAPADMATGSITGGPCQSGARGATALRVHWSNSGGTAVVNYDVHGLPDTSRWKVTAYGMIGFMPTFVDIPLGGGGGLQLDSSDFIDIELSTAGVHHLNSVTLSLFGRSYSVDTDGSFTWQTATGSNATDIDSLSNVVPYHWTSGDATTEIGADDGTLLIRVRAGADSNSLVVNRLEICMDAS